MPPTDAQVAGAAATLHRETSRNTRTSMRIHKETLEQLAAVRDALNTVAGARIVTNDDVVRLALAALGAFSLEADPDAPDVAEETADVVMPLADAVRDTTEAEEWINDVVQTTGSGGED